MNNFIASQTLRHLSFSILTFSVAIFDLCLVKRGLSFLFSLIGRSSPPIETSKLKSGARRCFCHAVGIFQSDRIGSTTVGRWFLFSCQLKQPRNLKKKKKTGTWQFFFFLITASYFFWEFISTSFQRLVRQTCAKFNRLKFHFGLVIFQNLKIVGDEREKERVFFGEKRAIDMMLAGDLDVHYVTHPCPTSAPAGWSLLKPPPPATTCTLVYPRCDAKTQKLRHRGNRKHIATSTLLLRPTR